MTLVLTAGQRHETTAFEARNASKERSSASGGGTHACALIAYWETKATAVARSDAICCDEELVTRFHAGALRPARDHLTVPYTKSVIASNA